MRWGIWHWRAMVWLAVTLAIFLLAWQPPVLWQRVSLAVQDVLVQQLASDQPETRLVLVDIDEASLDMMGPWPWSRALIAELSQVLVDRYQVPVVGLDIVFPEPQQEQADAVLAEVLRTRPVIPVVVWDFVGQTPPLLVGQAGQGLRLSSVSGVAAAQGVLGNHARLAQAAPLTAHIAPLADVAGQMRYLPPLVAWEDAVYPMLSLAMLSAMTGRPLQPVMQEGDLVPFADGHWRLKLGDQGWTVPYRRSLSAFTVVPAWQVLLGQVPDGLMAGKAVLVGSSAMGLADRVSTPLAPVAPGMLVHAQAFSSLLDFPRQSGVGVPVWLVSLLMLMVLAVVLVRQHMWAALLLWVSLSLGWLAWVSLVYLDGGVLEEGLLPVFAGVLLFGLQAPLEWAMVRRESQRIYRLFRDYLPASVLTQLMRRGDAQVLAPQQRVVTVLFADMEGFTTMASQLPTAQAAALTRQVLGILTQVVHAHEGTLDKYMGDALMAFWNAPLDQPDHARQAVACARQMLERMALFNQQQQALGLPQMGVRIGINSGEVLVGDLGTELRHAYTVLGDAVNVAHRLQVLTRRYQVGVLLGEATAQAIDGTVLVAEVSLRGRARLERVFTLAPG